MSNITVLCISSAVKGQRLIQELKRQGCRVFLLTEERWHDDDWPHESLDGIHFMHSMANRAHVINAASYMARGLKFDLIIPLDEYEVETAGVLREHFQMPGMLASEAQPFNDKLAMRVRARAAGIPVPDFTAVFHYDTLREWMENVPAPWLLKPRHEAGAMGIKRCENGDDVWRWLNELGDQQSFRLLEKFMPSDVFHVDTIVWRGEIQFAAVSAYGKPPLAVSHSGGVFTTRLLDRHSPEAIAAREMNAQVIRALGGDHFTGVVHAEYLRTLETKQWLFLEAAARVGGANISDMIEHGTGVNPWVEWARMELAKVRGENYTLPALREDYAGILVCLARQEHPDLSAYNDAEIAWRMNKKYHAGLIVVSADAARVQALLDSYAQRFSEDFLTRATPMETGRQA